MEREISNLIKIWAWVLVSLCYSYTVGKITEKGHRRFAFLAPVIALFVYLPMFLHSIHFGSMVILSFPFLANFKLGLFSYGKGPLSSSSSAKPIPFSLFLAIFFLPVMFPEQPPKIATTKQKVSLPKLLLLALLIKLYNYSSYFLQPVLILCIIYLLAESIVALVSAAALALSGVEPVPVFDEPYLSTSLRDFWGKRWNRVVSSILRQLVYDPALGFFSAHIISRKWAPLPAGMVTFLASGLLHELLLYYLGCRSSDGKMSLFFVLHGVGWCVEIWLKKLSFGEKLRFPRYVSLALTLGFVMSTCIWLFVPPFLNEVQLLARVNQEHEAFSVFMRNVTSYILQ